MQQTYKVTIARSVDDEVFLSVISDPSDFNPDAKFLVLRFDEGADRFREDDEAPYEKPPAMLAVRLRDDVDAVIFEKQ